jgi:DNA-binding LacI/PurR family transcriptional regulator
MRPTSHRKRSTGRITLSDVARVAGVSPITVSRALRGERSVDPALVERVTRASTQLGYVPDPAARALASQRSNHVAILIPLLSNALFVDLLAAAQRTLRTGGFQTLIGVTHYDAAQEEQLLREQSPASTRCVLIDRAGPQRRDLGIDGTESGALCAPDGYAEPVTNILLIALASDRQMQGPP